MCLEVRDTLQYVFIYILFLELFFFQTRMARRENGSTGYYIKCRSKRGSLERFHGQISAVTNVFGKRVPEGGEERSVSVGSALGPG